MVLLGEGILIKYKIKKNINKIAKKSKVIYVVFII